MLRNYIVIGLRNLLKNKLFSVINISGMAISAACFIIITLFVTDELRYDRHIDDVGLKFRVYNEMYADDGSVRKSSMVPPMFAPTLTTDYPEIDYTFRLLNFNAPILFTTELTKATEGGGGYGEATMFDMFSLPLIEGDRETILSEPNSIAISLSMAKKYFGDKPALGKTIKVRSQDVNISGVYADFPTHSHLHLNYILRFDDIAKALGDRMQSWQWNQFHTYIKLKPGSDAVALDGKLKDFAERHAWPVTKPNGGWYIPHLLAVDRIHLHASDHSFDIADRGSAQTVYILSVAAIFILVIAILNFVNLSTARAINRMKEVGIRKSVGALRTQLVRQFMSESVIVAVISLLIGVVLVQLALPSLNSFTEKRIPLSIFLNPTIVMSIFGLALMIGLAAGAYPALYISSFKPSAILSGKQSTTSGKNILRKGLVVVQFILSFFMIISAIVVSDQLKYMQTKDMGFQMDNLIVIPIRGAMNSNMDAAKNEFMNHPNVISASLGYGLPGQAFAGDGFHDRENGKDWHVSLLTVDEDYIKTLGLTVVAGREFSKDIPTDVKDAFIISEATAKMIGHTDPKDAIGHRIGWDRWDEDGAVKEGTVVGVIKDLHLNSLHQAMTPVMLQLAPFAYNTLTIKVKGEDMQATIAHMESTWKKLESDWPFEYKFLDSNFDKLYKAEEKLASLITFFTGFAIFVACLGLFGLVVYNTSQRYREISIRKVLGAKESQLVIQLGKNYVLLICAAFAVAVPFSWYAAQQWLETFPYRTEITSLLFVKAGLAILVVAMITVGVQSLKAARTNPVNALKEQ